MKNKLIIGLLIATIAWSGSFAFAAAQGMTLSQLVELLISLNIIPSDKAAAARLAVSGTTTNPTVTTTVRKSLVCGSKGDLNGDGYIDTTDKDLLSKVVTGSSSSTLSKADLNGDGAIDALDFTLMGRFLSGLDSTFTGCTITTTTTQTVTQTVSTCTDSDGGKNPDIAGTADGRVNGVGTYISDASVASNGGACSGMSCTGVTEGYCENGQVKNVMMQCSSGYSVNGACAAKPVISALSATITSPSSGESVSLGASVNFTGNVSGGQGAYKVTWNFDADGTSYLDGSKADSAFQASGSRSASYSFNTAGTWRVTLVAVDEQGSTVTSPVINITVVAPTTSSDTTAAPVPTNTTPSITVTNPNGGETLQIGTNYTIRWSSQNIASGTFLHIMLADAAGNDLAYIKSWLSSSNSEYVWTVTDFYPSVVGGSYKISVKTSEGTVRDVSDSPMTFAAAASALNYTGLNLGSAVLSLDEIMKVLRAFNR